MKKKSLLIIVFLISIFFVVSDASAATSYSTIDSFGTLLCDYSLGTTVYISETETASIKIYNYSNKLYVCYPESDSTGGNRYTCTLGSFSQFQKKSETGLLITSTTSTLASTLLTYMNNYYMCPSKAIFRKDNGKIVFYEGTINSVSNYFSNTGNLNYANLITTNFTTALDKDAFVESMINEYKIYTGGSYSNTSLNNFLSEEYDDYFYEFLLATFNSFSTSNNSVSNASTLKSMISNYSFYTAKINAFYNSVKSGFMSYDFENNLENFEFDDGEVTGDTCESGCTYSLSKSGYESVTINIYYNGSQWVKQFSADGVNVTTTSPLSVSILDNSSDENISYDIESSLLNASISTVYEATYYGYAKYTDTVNVAKYKVCLASSASYCENSLKNYDEYCYYNGSTIVCYSSSSTTTSTEITDVDCDSILGSPKVDGSPAYYLTYAFKIIRYVAIILLIVLTVMDFLGPIASQDQDAIKKAVRKAVTRLVICIVIWLLPYLLEMILELIHEAYTDFPECGVGIDY